MQREFVRTARRALRAAGRRCVAGSLAAAMLLAGCEVGPDYKPPQVQVNGSFPELHQPTTMPTTLPFDAQGRAGNTSQPTGRPVQITQWWATFGDPVLDSLIDRAVRNNLNLQVAASRIRESRFQRLVVASNQYPQVNVDGSYTHTRFSENGLPIGGPTAPTNKTSISAPESASISRNATTGGGASASSSGSNLFSNFKQELDLYQAGFDASWEIDVFGGVRREVEAANASIEANVENTRDVLISLLAEVARNYIDLRGTQRQMAIAIDNLRTQQQSLELTRQRLNAGVATDLDVARAASQVATTAAAIPLLHNQIRQTVHRLGVLLGQDPASLSEELHAEKPIPVPPGEVPVGLPSDLLRRRPDIRRAERQLAASSANIGVATSDLFPKFSLTGSFGLQSEKPKNLFDWNSRFYSLGPAVSWPIFDAGRIRNNIQVFNERERQALATYQQTVLQALEDVEDSLSAYETEQVRRRALADAVAADQHAVDLANQLYAQGVVDFLQVLDAERSLFSSQDALAQSDRNVSIDLVALYKSLGGGWEVDPTQTR